MGRREAPIPEGPLHDFAQGLRDLRASAPGKPTYRELERRARYSHSALSDAAAGRRLPTWAITKAFVEACEGDVDEWQRRWQELRDVLLATDPGLAAETDDPDSPDAPRGSHARPEPEGAPAPAADPGLEPPADRKTGAAPPSSPAAAPLTATDPTRIGPFRLLGRLGGGAMGQVYLGASKAGRPVAVKVIRAHLAEDPDFRRRFAAEVAAARSVQGAYTPAVVDADPQAAQPWMATTYIAGPSLSEAVDRGGPLPPAAVAGLAAGIAEALRAIHAAGVLHRDLKPANVLLDADGPKVIDFGIARSLDASRLTQTGAQLGTIPFMAPEQADGRPVTGAADVFSLGSLLAYAATGIAPFGDGSSGQVLYRIVHCDPDPAALACEDNNLRVLIKACLDKDPDRRPTPEQIIDACTDRHEGLWLPAALAAQVAARRDEASALLAKEATRRTVIRVKMSVVPLLLAVAVIVAAVLASPGRTSPDSSLQPSDGPVPSAVSPLPIHSGTASSRTAVPPTNTPAQQAQNPSLSTNASSATQPHGGPPGDAGETGNTSARPKTFRSGAPRLLGTPDFDGYCRATGQGPVRLTANNAYGWRCSADNGTGDDAEAVCAWTYHTSTDQVTNRVTDFNDPHTWQCWHATRELGPLDFNAYCTATGHPGATYTSGRYAYGWYCTGSSTAIDTQAACQTIYHSTPPVSRFQNFYDKDSWQCWG
ncbi:serine/threonine-protein kinase [Streptomyces sp. NPDC048192]|uniref:serine/threonine-protein kinase n=1 Tax=Streptomyces sp. NPDC048192 TaxID=3365510 RepID=UPI0037241BF5